jgi:hypothetical protein
MHRFTPTLPPGPFKPKDFHDPIKNRQILWIWGTIPSGIQAIPRSMTYHPGIRQIVYAPCDEITALRTGQLSALAQTTLTAGESASMEVSGACDIEVFFQVPTTTTTLSIAVGGGSFFITVQPPSGAGPTMAAVGFKTVGAGGPEGGFADTVPLLADDTHIAMRVFLDNVVAECYWQGGRVAMTVPSKPVTSASLSATGQVVLLNATAYGMGEIMTTKDEVLAAPRLQPQ